MLITDVVMPGMTGPELARQLALVRPHIQVLYMSGYTERVLAQQGALPPGSAYLDKPFTLDALARKVRQLLDAARVS
jgi:CheY-like chemotaxis protein